MECYQPLVEVADERSVAVEDTSWDQTCQLPDKGHVNALLDISEDTSFKDQEPYEFLCLPGWDEAIQGWGRTPPLACLFQTQRRGKRTKTGDPEHHCLLCVDMKFSEPPDSPESCCESTQEPWGKNTPSTLEDLLNKSYTHTSSVSSSQKDSPSPESPALRVLRKATQQLMLGDQMKEEGKLGELSDYVPGSAPSQTNLPVSECPLMRDRNVTLIINSFAVLPPVKASQPRHLKIPVLLRRATAASGHSPADGQNAESESGGVAPAEESEGVERGGEMRADNVLDTGSLTEDAYHGSLTSKYWPSQQSNHLLSAFSFPVSKRYDAALTTLAEPLPRATYPLGRHLKQEPRPELRTGSGHRLYIGLKTKSMRRAEPQLPILFGTRVPIPASTQRLL